MFFLSLTFFAAFVIEAIGTYVSVVGLSALFGANPVIISLAVALDLGKIVVVTLLYKYWGELGKLMKTYALLAAAVTMVITSAGAAGYLSGEFQKAIMGTQEGTLKVDVLKQEQTKLEARKKQIDDQIANLPANYSRSRVTLMKQFETEQASVTARLNEISKELPELQIAQIGVEAKAGPILYISKAFDIPVESAVKWVILLIIFVFDPLAVFLIIAGNFLLDQYKRKKTDVLAADPGRGNPLEPAITKADVERIAIENYPDASQAKVYTRDDLIAAGASDEMLIQAGYEPREAAKESAKEPAPIVSEVAPDVQEVPVEEAAKEPALSAEERQEQLKHAYEVQEARKVGMSLEAWRAAQLKKLDRMQEDLDALNRKVQQREVITLSSLGLVKPDPNTVVDAADTTGLGALDPRVRPDIFPPR